MDDLHPATAHVLQFFKYDHLPAHLKTVASRFADIANTIANEANNPETTVALRKLLEAKDAAVRAVLAQGMADNQRNIDAMKAKVDAAMAEYENE